MTKADIVSEIAKSTGAEKVQVQAIVEAFMESIKGSLAQNNNVYLRGFGSFIVKNARRRWLVTFPRIRPLRSRPTTFRPSSLQRVLRQKLNK